MHKLKGLYCLLDAIKQLTEVNLRIIGEKDDFIDKRITSVGVKRGKDLVEEMQKATLWCFLYCPYGRLPNGAY